MKLEKSPAVERGWMVTHINRMPKIYFAKGVNDLWATVACQGGRPSIRFTPQTRWRVFLSGAETLTLFGTMRDLVPQIEESMSMQSLWEGVGEQIRRAAEQETKSAIDRRPPDRQSTTAAAPRGSSERHAA